MSQATLLDELKLEHEYNVTAMDKYRESLDKAIENDESSRTAIGRAINNHLFKTVYKNMETFFTELTKPKRGVKPTYYETAKAVTETYAGKERDLYSLLALSTLSNTLNCSSIKKARGSRSYVSYIAKRIADSVFDEADIEHFMTTHDKELQDMMERGLHSRKSDYYRRYYAQYIMNREHYKGINVNNKDKILFGAQLLDILINSTDFFEYYDEQYKDNMTIKAVRPTQKLIDTWNTNEDYLLQLVHSNCPMIITPDPWISFTEGGYYGELRRFSTLLRLHNVKNSDKYTRKYLEKLNQVDIDNVLEAINSIQSTPWHIDKNVLKVAKMIIERGGDMAGIPRMEPLPTLPKLNNPTKEELKEHKRKLVNIYKLENSRRGRAIRCLATIKTADRFKDYENIYFPCNMDFRGRVYPIPSFSFQGDDLTKALIQFSDVPGLKCEEDMKWFFIAGANFAGVDKVSFDDRISYIKSNEENILKTAEDPMGMLDFWGEMDCPFEFLQFCYEYKSWYEYKFKYGTSVGFKTGMPIAFDGSCSGIQHYSAMLRDPVGAKAVNLEPADKPSDIYGMVAVEVNKYLDEDAKNGDPDYYDEKKEKNMLGTKTMAQLWKEYGVNRKVTKRSVMTLAYGSKEYGFKFQILEDTINPHMGNGIFTPENSYAMATYMAKLIWMSVHRVVTKAVEGMEWLQKVASIICKDGNVVSWTTPMGLPIQQSYLENKTEVYRMRISKQERRFYSTENTDEIASRKQRQGIAPNFIHSMDASHLQFSTVMAHRKGINHFAMIHDSYGTTLAQAGLLYRTIRECFVSMYTSHDIMKEFAEEVHNYTNEELPPLPEKGNFDITKVLDSLYAFH